MTPAEGRRSFPSLAARDRAIVDLALAGLPPLLIEQKIAASRSVIYNALRAARRRGKALPAFPRGGSRRQAIGPLRTVLIYRDDYDALAGPATRRKMSVPALVRLLIETIASDGLVDAILDDGEEARTGEGPTGKEARSAERATGMGTLS